MLEDVNDEIPLFTEREQETVLEGEPIGTKVTQVNAIDKDGTFPNNQVRFMKNNFVYYIAMFINIPGKQFYTVLSIQFLYSFIAILYLLYAINYIIYRGEHFSKEKL